MRAHPNFATPSRIVLRNPMHIFPYAPISPPPTITAVIGIPEHTTQQFSVTRPPRSHEPPQGASGGLFSAFGILYFALDQGRTWRRACTAWGARHTGTATIAESYYARANAASTCLSLCLLAAEERKYKAPKQDIRTHGHGLSMTCVQCRGRFPGSLACHSSGWEPF